MRLADAVCAYVETRRLSGSPFVSSEATLRAFCRYCGDIDVKEVTADLVSRFSGNPKCAPVTRVSKFSGVKCFVDYLSLRGELPPLSLLKPVKPRDTRSPFIYTRSEITALLNATPRCQEKALDVEAKTFRLFLLMLYATGATVAEVVGLRWSSVDLRKRLITIGKNPSKLLIRCLPIGVDLATLLTSHYKAGSVEGRNAFVLSKTDGGPINPRNLGERFDRLRALAGLRKSIDGRLPRLQDFRYTFAAHRLNLWIERGDDLNTLLPALSTYMGYASLTAAEQFLAFVPNRFKQDLQRLSPLKGRRTWSKDTELMEFLSTS